MHVGVCVVVLHDQCTALFSVSLVAQKVSQWRVSPGGMKKKNKNVGESM